MVDASLKENSAVFCGARCPLSAISAVDQVLKIAVCIHTSMRTPCDEVVIRIHWGDLAAFSNALQQAGTGDAASRFGARILGGDEDADSARFLAPV